MKSVHVTIIIPILLLGPIVQSAKILVIFPLPIKSHVGAFQLLMEELAQRGHEMTVVTPFPRSKPLANYSELIYEDIFPPRDSVNMNLFEHGKNGMLSILFLMTTVFVESCKKLINQKNVQMLLQSTEVEFDLIMYEPIGSQCLYGLLHKFKSPTIQIFPNTINPWISNSVGNPSTLSYLPDVTTQKDKIDFTTRLFSVLKYFPFGLIQRYIEFQMTLIMRENSPNSALPSIFEFESNTSFLFTHSHPILNYPQPLTPNTIEVGGLHIKVTKKLPLDLQKFLDDAPYGVIYFSLGSNVRGVDMPDAMRNGILKSFSKLKQKVLWKWEEDTMTGKPNNVLLSKWVPQHDVLAHPNVKLFITHGGLMSIEEATYFGIPMVAIPVMGDQQFNALHAQNSGYAIVLEVQNITEKSLAWAIHEVLNKPCYKERAQQLSRIFQDQPQTPLDRAVFWTEYAIRHRGAPHLHSAAIDLNLFQYYLLDVIAVLTIILFSSLIFLVYVGKQLFKLLFSKTNIININKKIN